METPFFYPPVRTRPFGHRHLTAWAIVKIGLVTLLAPAAVGGLMVALSFPFLNNLENSFLSVVAALGGLLFFAPVYGFMTIPFALLLGAWAMRFGLAGWAVALIAGVILPLALGGLYQFLDPTTAAIGTMLILTPIVVVHAVALWCATRWIAPDTLIAPDQ